MGDSVAADLSSKKYDRQVRIWGAHGQAALEGCHVCCLGASALASEVLKNLVLGGIAGFTLVDDAKVGPNCIHTGCIFVTWQRCDGHLSWWSGGTLGFKCTVEFQKAFLCFYLKVKPRDLGNNFLVEQSNLGQPLAQVVTDLLKEFNDAVVGSYVEESPREIVENNPSFFKDFQLVVGTQVCHTGTS
jgi:NEDD8-activating enzyme E1 regulatory subunit